MPHQCLRLPGGSFTNYGASAGAGADLGYFTLCIADPTVDCLVVTLQSVPGELAVTPPRLRGIGLLTLPSSQG